MLERVSYPPFPQAPQDHSVKVVTGKELARALRRQGAAAKAVTAADIAAGRLVIDRPTPKQARAVTGASASYVGTALALSPMERQAFRAGRLKLADARALSDARLDKLVHRIGPDKVMAALDRATAPTI
jgi:hypothetical protein